MRTGMVFCAVVAMFGLTAAKCTPEEIAAAVDDYAAHMRTPDPAPVPTITVTADCTTFAVHGEGWPDGSSISMTIESESGWQLTPVGGVADASMEVWDGYGTYYWSTGGLLHLATEPTVVKSGTVECGPRGF